MDIHRRPISGINDPTPNSSSLSPSPSSSSLSAARTSRLLSPQASSSSTFTAQSVSIPASSNQLVPSPSKLNVNLGMTDWANIVAVAQTCHILPATSTVSSFPFNLPSDPLVITQQLTEINKKEEEIVTRRKNLEAQLAEIRSEENDLFTHRSQLTSQLERVLSPQSSFTSNPVTTPIAISPTIKPRETTIIEELDPETLQPRSSDSNASMTSLTKKRPGPASKTGGLKVINPGSLPPLGPTSSSSKKSQNGDGSSKKPVTTGVKQSRPQPMRARKRTKPGESGPSTAPPSQVNPDLVQTNNESQPQPKPQTPTQPQPKPQAPTQPPVQTQPQQSKPSSTPQKSQVPIVKNPVFKEKVKTEPEEKPRIPSAILKKDDSLKPSPFKERAESSNSTESETLKRKIKQEPTTKPKKPENIVMATDEDSEAVRCNPVQDDGADDDDEAHSDSEIFNVLRSVEQSNEDTPEIGAKKIKKDPDQPSNLVTPRVEPQEATRREPNIKKEK